MLTEWDPAATQRAIEWAQKLTFLLIFLTSQTEVAGIESKQSKIIEEILQFRIEFGFLRAWTTTSESPLRINLSKEKRAS